MSLTTTVKQEHPFDLKNTYPDLRGFSRRNLNYMRSFFNLIDDDVIVQHLAAQISWEHVRFTLTK